MYSLYSYLWKKHTSCTIDPGLFFSLFFELSCPEAMIYLYSDTTAKIMIK